MSAPDVPWRPILYGGLAVAAVIAAAIGASAGLLHVWHAPADGDASGASSLLPALQSRGPALQSAPQIDAAAIHAEQARQRAAAGVQP